MFIKYVKLLPGYMLGSSVSKCQPRVTSMLNKFYVGIISNANLQKKISFPEFPEFPNACATSKRHL